MKALLFIVLLKLLVFATNISTIHNQTPWVLALKMQPGDSRWAYTNTQWASTATFSDNSNVKTSYYSAPFRKLKIVMNNLDSKAVIWTNSNPTRSLHHYFKNDEWYSTGGSKTDWYNIAGDGVAGIQPHCNKIGFNTKKSGAKSIRPSVKITPKFGIMMNQENDCNSCDTAIGFGFSDKPYVGARTYCCCSSGSCTNQAFEVKVYVCGGDNCGKRQAYAILERGTVCSTPDLVIVTRSECEHALKMLNLMNQISNPWIGQHSKIPAGCSTRTSWGRNMHVNSQEFSNGVGVGRADLQPICKSNKIVSPSCTKYSTRGWNSGTYEKTYQPHDSPNGQNWS